MALNLRVHRVRRKVQFPCPANRSVFEEHLREEIGICDLCKHAGVPRMDQRRHIYLPLNPIVEPDEQTETFKRRHFGHIIRLVTHDCRERGGV